MFRTSVIALLLLAILPVSAQESDRANRLLQQIDEIRVKYEVPAVGVLLVDPDSVSLSRTWGTADVTSGKPATKDTVFRIGSVTKSFTSLAMLLLDDRNVLKLSDQITKHRAKPPVRNRWHHSNPITVAQLLEHTAGFTDMSGAEFNYTGEKPLTLEQAFKINPNSRMARWPPGVHSSYSNSGAGVAAWIAEARLNDSFETFVEQEIFGPLAMDSATFFRTNQVKEHLATGYQADGVTTIPYWNMIYRPFGAINVTVDDMAPFLQLLLNHGSHNDQALLPKEAISRMEQPETTLSARSGLTYGYGLGNYQWYRDGFLFHGHGGDGDGYLAHYGYNREKNQAYFVVINAFHHRPLREMRHSLERYILNGGKKRTPESTMALTKVRMKLITGKYYQATQRFNGGGAPGTLDIIDKAGVLYTQSSSGKRLRLVPVTEEHFRRPNQPGATIAIIETDNHMVLQGDIGNYEKPLVN